MEKDRPPFWLPQSFSIPAQSGMARETDILLSLSNDTIWRYLLTPQEKRNLKPGLKTLSSSLFCQMLVRHPKITLKPGAAVPKTNAPPDWFFEKGDFTQKPLRVAYSGAQIWELMVPQADRGALAAMPPREGLVYVSQNIERWWASFSKNPPR